MYLLNIAIPLWYICTLYTLLKTASIRPRAAWIRGLAKRRARLRSITLIRMSLELKPAATDKIHSDLSYVLVRTHMRAKPANLVKTAQGMGGSEHGSAFLPSSAEC